MAESKNIETYRGTVYPWQCDHMGHMNVMWYTGKFDEATWQILAHIGLTLNYMKTQNKLAAAVRQEIDYKREVMAGSVIKIQTRILEMRGKVIKYCHEMINLENDEVVAISIITGVHMDGATHKACPVPDDILKRGLDLIEA